MNKALKITFKVLIAIVLVVVLAVLSYLGYVVFSYSRIEDNLKLEVGGAEVSDVAEVGKEYVVVTQNLGFGAYTRDFTFFMDGGKESRAKSAESVRTAINKGAQTVKSLNPDFVLFQEIDTDADRSHHIDQRTLINPYFADYASAFAENYHSAYLMYPLTKPHGASKAGIMTFSKSKITSSLRRSLPISTGFSKFLDLDRCYSITRVPVDNGKELVLFNVHLSAYGGSDEIRSAQVNMLLTDMQTEYEKGNYAVCGGDFNHDFTGDSTQKLNGGGEVDFGWAQPFPMDILKNYSGIERADAYDDGEVNPTCRNCDVPYEEGNFTIIVDGFLTSKNVKVVNLKNVVTGFEYSDHNPVAMRFVLN